MIMRNPELGVNERMTQQPAFQTNTRIEAVPGQPTTSLLPPGVNHPGGRGGSYPGERRGEG